MNRSDTMCQYCESKTREIKAIQSELNDYHIMMANRDRFIQKLEKDNSELSKDLKCALDKLNKSYDGN